MNSHAMPSPIVVITVAANMTAFCQLQLLKGFLLATDTPCPADVVTAWET